jgi:predicted NAD/FAD-binding protein
VGHKIAFDPARVPATVYYSPLGESILKVAVVGAGIAGLASAHYLDHDHEVTLFEARDRPGGHTNTVEFESGGRTVAVDTGFIVYNDRTYPNFIQLLDELDVTGEKTSMSFSVHDEASGLEYAGHSLDGLFAQRSNLLNGSFYRMLYDILRFNRQAPTVMERAKTPETVGKFLQREGYSEVFVKRYLVPMAAAIWSAPRQRIEEFPLDTFVAFFENHGLLQVTNRPTWRYIEGGSKRYVKKLLSRFGGRFELDTPVQRVESTDGGARVQTASDQLDVDAVVLAVHSDQALEMLASPSSTEEAVLGAIDYQTNRACLHTDPSVLPDNRSAWAAWNVRLFGDRDQPITVTYNMNILQQIETPDPLLVSLNMEERLDEDRVISRFQYDHPCYDTASDRARERWSEISGQRAIYYAGAYWGNGFHEDGVNSALDVVSQIEERAA